MLRFLAVHHTHLEEGTAVNASQSILKILADLCRNLTEEVGVAKDSLLEASVQGPMYGILHCIRDLLGDVDLRCVAVFRSFFYAE